MKKLCSANINCQNGGTCEEISDIRFICTCVDGYTGDNCETNIGTGAELSGVHLWSHGFFEMHPLLSFL